MIVIHKDNLTTERILNALLRRVNNFPHQLAWFSSMLFRPQEISSLNMWNGIHSGKRCFILGNGPSLAEMNISLLRDELTFGLNRIYLLFEEQRFTTNYFVSINDLVLQQSVKQISALRIPKFINWRARGQYGRSPDIYYLLERYHPGFCSTPMFGVWGGATVTFVALELAYFMGFQTVILVGVDHSFSTQGPPHKVVAATEMDFNHFHPKYFADGTLWQLPDLKTSEYAYRLARKAFEADGRQVLDATIGGKLDIFPKVDFNSLF